MQLFGASFPPHIIPLTFSKSTSPLTDRGRELAQASEPIVWVSVNFVHKSTSTTLRRLCALLPILHGTHRNAQELSENRLACAQEFAGTLDRLRVIILRLEIQANRTASEARFQFVATLDGVDKILESISKLLTYCSSISLLRILRFGHRILPFKFKL